VNSFTATTFIRYLEALECQGHPTVAFRLKRHDAARHLAFLENEKDAGKSGPRRDGLLISVALGCPIIAL
jgi:hypothetical protein